ncbi:hypothetical protein FJ366_04155 [Candidatus Dependentiae bacterium]|nr:hypothetical protein [Candidatus Dependentiae bacterium]
MDEKLKYSTEQIKKMLDSLGDASSEYTKKLTNADLNDDEIHRQCDFLRDSVIQRFEYTIEGFWKYLKTYLISQGIHLAEQTPRYIVRQSALARLITENEAQLLLEMITERNKTSHIYQEEVADKLAHYAPTAFTLMKNIVSRLNKK